MSLVSLITEYLQGETHIRPRVQFHSPSVVVDTIKQYLAQFSDKIAEVPYLEEKLSEIFSRNQFWRALGSVFFSCGTSDEILWFLDQDKNYDVARMWDDLFHRCDVAIMRSVSQKLPDSLNVIRDNPSFYLSTWINQHTVNDMDVIGWMAENGLMEGALSCATLNNLERCFRKNQDRELVLRTFRPYMKREDVLEYARTLLFLQGEDQFRYFVQEFDLEREDIHIDAGYCYIPPHVLEFMGIADISDEKITANNLDTYSHLIQKLHVEEYRATMTKLLGKCPNSELAKMILQRVPEDPQFAQIFRDIVPDDVKRRYLSDCQYLLSWGWENVSEIFYHPRVLDLVMETAPRETMLFWYMIYCDQERFHVIEYLAKGLDLPSITESWEGIAMDVNPLYFYRNCLRLHIQDNLTPEFVASILESAGDELGEVDIVREILTTFAEQIRQMTRDQHERCLQMAGIFDYPIFLLYEEAHLPFLIDLDPKYQLDFGYVSSGRLCYHVLKNSHYLDDAAINRITRTCDRYQENKMWNEILKYLAEDDDRDFFLPHICEIMKIVATAGNFLRMDSLPALYPHISLPDVMHIMGRLNPDQLETDLLVKWLSQWFPQTPMTLVAYVFVYCEEDLPGARRISRTLQCYCDNDAQVVWDSRTEAINDNLRSQVREIYSKPKSARK